MRKHERAVLAAGLLLIGAVLAAGCGDDSITGPSNKACRTVEHAATTKLVVTSAGPVLVLVPAWTEEICE